MYSSASVVVRETLRLMEAQDQLRAIQWGRLRREVRKGVAATAVVRLVNATNVALDQIELEPGIGSPSLGMILGIPALRTWRVAKFPLLWRYFKRDDQACRAPEERDCPKIRCCKT